jgi:hypothetical protein
MAVVVSSSSVFETRREHGQRLGSSQDRRTFHLGKQQGRVARGHLITHPALDVCQTF